MNFFRKCKRLIIDHNNFAHIAAHPENGPRFIKISLSIVQFNKEIYFFGGDLEVLDSTKHLTLTPQTRERYIWAKRFQRIV